MKVDVVGIDYPPMDLFAQIEKLPHTDEAIMMKDHCWQGGGNVCTAIAALGRFGVKAGMIGVVGRDAFGRFCMEDFKRHGVDTSQMVVDENGTTSLCLCLAERSTKGRSFIVKRGTRRELVPDDLDRDYIASARFIHLVRTDSVSIQACEWARESGTKVAIDAGSYDRCPEEHLKYIDVFIASEFYYKAVFNNLNYRDNCKRIQEKGPEVVVFTLGHKGSVVLYGDTYFEMPTFNNVDVVDTTGAGDVFHGAFLYGMLQEWKPEETARFATAVSSIKCTRLGGRAGIPDVATVERFLKDGFIDYTDIDKRCEFYKNIFSE